MNPWPEEPLYDDEDEPVYDLDPDDLTVDDLRPALDRFRATELDGRQFTYPELEAIVEDARQQYAQSGQADVAAAFDAAWTGETPYDFRNGWDRGEYIDDRLATMDFVGREGERLVERAEQQEAFIADGLDPDDPAHTEDEQRERLAGKFDEFEQENTPEPDLDDPDDRAAFIDYLIESEGL